MKFREYVASHGLTLCFIGLGAVLLFLFSALQDIRTAFILFAEFSLLLLTALWLVTGFLIQKKRYEELNRTISQLHEKYLLGEVLTKPTNENELLYYEVMKTISFDAIRTVERAKQDKEDYALFVEGWIHEMKTPLTACSLILENSGSIPKLRREIKLADNLTESILYYARLKAPEKDTVIRPVSVTEVAGDALRDQMPLLRAAGISAETSGDFTVHTDDKALGFILKQLLCNSAKYCPGCHISIHSENGTITYEDNGIGIPAHDLPRITQCGFTGTNGRKNGSSTGMGLYLVGEMCRHLNMTLKVESEPNRFTRFMLSFDSLTKL